MKKNILKISLISFMAATVLGLTSVYLFDPHVSGTKEMELGFLIFRLNWIACLFGVFGIASGLIGCFYPKD